MDLSHPWKNIGERSTEGILADHAGVYINICDIIGSEK